MERMRSQETQRGFTLLELLVSSAVAGIVLVGIYTAYSASHTTSVRGGNRAELQQNARVGMEMMAREIRMAGYDPDDVLTALSTTAIQAANPNDITFIADVDGNGSTDWVKYRLGGTDGTQLFQDSSSWVPGAPGAWNPALPPPDTNPNNSVLADAVRPAVPNPPGPGLAFQYFDGSDNPIAAPVPAASLGNIRRITITLTTQETAGGRLETFPMTMDVRLRN